MHYHNVQQVFLCKIHKKTVFIYLLHFTVYTVIWCGMVRLGHVPVTVQKKSEKRKVSKMQNFKKYSTKAAAWIMSVMMVITGVNLPSNVIVSAAE